MSQDLPIPSGFDPAKLLKEKKKEPTINVEEVLASQSRITVRTTLHYEEVDEPVLTMENCWWDFVPQQEERIAQKRIFLTDEWHELKLPAGGCIVMVENRKPTSPVKLSPEEQASLDANVFEVSLEEEAAGPSCYHPVVRPGRSYCVELQDGAKFWIRCRSGMRTAARILVIPVK